MPSNNEIDALLLPELENIGKNLRKLRVQHGMTQEQLAKAVRLNIRTLQRIEAGKTNILVTTALRLIASIGCNPNELLQHHMEVDQQH